MLVDVSYSRHCWCHRFTLRMQFATINITRSFRLFLLLEHQGTLPTARTST